MRRVLLDTQLLCVAFLTCVLREPDGHRPAHACLIPVGQLLQRSLLRVDQRVHGVDDDGPDARFCGVPAQDGIEDRQEVGQRLAGACAAGYNEVLFRKSLAHRLFLVPVQSKRLPLLIPKNIGATRVQHGPRQLLDRFHLLVCEVEL